ncbi:VOC family protein [Paraburkholderia nodosa]|uniref:VOC family protein n=1 Tax=Paraburkholderia nodosa TaxID=392320 RepID=UPI00048174CD|nr:VOC family protein [Paraburkholderia nodosa]
MFSHVVVGTNDLKKAKRFYDAVLGSLGYGEGLIRDAGGYLYVADNSFFIVTGPLDGQAATHANGGTIGFTCRSTDQVDLWHAAGVANGGKSVEDPPGVRETPAVALYLAYLRDPDGNKLCALYRIRA